MEFRPPYSFAADIEHLPPDTISEVARRAIERNAERVEAQIAAKLEAIISLAIVRARSQVDHLIDNDTLTRETMDEIRNLMRRTVIVDVVDDAG